MNVLSKTMTTAFKSALMSSALFILLLIGINEDISFETLPYIFYILIITFIISIIAIPLTIVPFYYGSTESPLEEICKRYFPYYAMLFFALCISLSITIDFNIASLIFGIAYITAMFAWMWFYKPDKVFDNDI